MNNPGTALPQQPYQQPYQQPVAPQQPMMPQQSMVQTGPSIGVPGMPPGQIPNYYAPDNDAVNAAYQQARDEAATWNNNDGPVYLKFLGPNGQATWDANSGVLPGYTSEVLVYILPPWAEGRGIFLKVTSHFWRSYQYPKGMGINCPGDPHCLVCQAKGHAMAMSDPVLQRRAKSFGRVQKQFWYNVVVLNNPQGHINQQGVMRPVILRAGHHLHRAIGDFVSSRGGAAAIVDPMRGRPMLLKKTKTGPSQMDVEYSAVDMDPQPLPEVFYPALQNLWDLDQLNKTPTQEEMAKAVADMNLPLAANAGGLQAPNPPYGNPYEVQNQASGIMNTSNQVPTGMGQPMVATPMPGTAPVQPQTPMPQQNMMVPNTAPVPVQSTGTAVPSSYQPKQNQMTMGGPPPVSMNAPPIPVSPVGGTVPNTNQQMTPIQLSLPLPVGFNLPGSREKCFGKFNSSHQYCMACTDWIKTQCQALTGQSQQQAPVQSLEQLQHQIAGK
jgi:hypothetical protein